MATGGGTRTRPPWFSQVYCTLVVLLSKSDSFLVRSLVWATQPMNTTMLLEGNICLYSLAPDPHPLFTHAHHRILDKRFEELGAQRVYPRGEGDDDSRFIPRLFLLQ